MSFKVPYDSSPPSTPGKGRSLFGNVSMTPGGAPPSEANSFTPQGPPPSTIYGSSQMSSRSQFDSPQALFTKSGNINPNDSIFGSSITSNDYPVSRGRKEAPANRSFAASSVFSVGSSRFGESFNSRASNEFGSSQMDQGPGSDAEDMLPEDESEEERVDTNKGIGQAPKANNPFSFLDSQFDKPMFPPPTKPVEQRKPLYSNPDNAKRPKLDDKWMTQSPLRKTKLSPKKDSAMPSIVRNFASRSRVTSVEESSSLIIETEDEICNMYDAAKQAGFRESEVNATFSDTCTRLVDIWKTHAGWNNPQGLGIGPGDRASNVAKAGFLGSLLIRMHHRPLVHTRTGGFAGPMGFPAPRAPVPAGFRSDFLTPMPKVLLDWLNLNHAQQTADLRTLKEIEPNPTSSSTFWEAINTAVLRGHLSQAAEVLRSADFNYARSALEDGLPQPGYKGAQLQNIQKCINRALQVLTSCPSIRDDWDVRGAEWGLYRKRVVAAVADLEEFAEGNEQPEPEPPVLGNRFQAANFGLKPSPNTQNFSFTQSSRMAESRVPWAIYQNLRSLYRILLGDTGAIMRHSQDWIEATVALTVWWDGEIDDDAPVQQTGIISNQFLRPQLAKTQTPAVGNNPPGTYLRRLELALSSATNQEQDNAGFRINSLSSLEVGLASVFEGDVGGVIELLQTWSLCIASAVGEVAAAGGWLDSATGKKPLSGLSENDLMVLSYGQDDGASSRKVNKDDLLSDYASGLFERPRIENESGSRIGWELALEVMSRLDDKDKMQKKVSEMVDTLPLNDAVEMDRVVLLCSELGLHQEGRRVSERYGDMTVDEGEEYGLALMCYARAHNRHKVKSVVDLLISYSLVQSRAYPATADLDTQLSTLVKEPKTCLASIASIDEEAANIIQFYFSGYATLRRFYETRDEGLNEGQPPRFKPLARRRAAAKALVAVISSAADSIYGGLFDPECDSAIQVDGLLVLMGEALAFIDPEPTPMFTVDQQFAILSAIEDLETVTPRVYRQCAECFRATLLQYQSLNSGDQSQEEAFILPPSRELLKKSVTSLAPPSTFSFIGNDMVGSARNRSMSGSGASSGVLIARPGDGAGSPERGWDWRASLPEDVKGEDVLLMLRLGLARGLSAGALGSV
ncbi:putative nuclear pore complex subunit Nup85 [Aspergillus affinis]|uniref:putative nuclear pore complex subunit Nup85 n=1 Tax=Aspergillus affinis TaxID=1070780 RepID=UPI0022FE7734|nr:nuclear pore complex subunit Nup85 [Aspergillus affinis]KAI9043548.1 nuclear pore complex subunit Nup85 [Aspergillus affinis]